MGRHERTQRVGGTHSVRSFPNHSLDDPTPAAVLLDRQSSLVRKVCASSLPARSTAIERIRASLDELRAVGLRIGVLSHNRADDWEHFDVDEITAMNGRIEHSLGPVDLWCVCLVADDGSCACTPADNSGVLVTAAQALGIDQHCALVATDDRRLVEAAGREEVANLFAELDGVEASPDERVTMEAGALGRAAEWIVLESSLRPDGQFRHTTV